MKPSVLYRVASVLLVVFAAGHTLGFVQTDPEWGVGPMLSSMQSTHFVVQGFTRTYWDFLLGAGFTVSSFYLFAAVLALELAALPARTRALMGATSWSFACCFAVITVLNWTYLFWSPIVLSFLITVCLLAAAWRSGSEVKREQWSVALD